VETTSKVRLPLIVDEHGDLELFRDVASMERYLEAIDVQNHEYVVYDSEGRLVELTTVEVPTQTLFGLLKGTVEIVRVGSVESEPTCAMELSTKLRAHLARLDEIISPQAPLHELVDRLQRRAGFVA
jgi:hypothetical protein